MTTLTPQQLREKYKVKPKSPSFFDAPVASKAISVLRDPDKVKGGFKVARETAGQLISDFSEKNRAEQDAAKTPVGKLGVQFKQGGNLALNFAREIAAGAAVLTKSALPEAKEGAPRFGLSDEQQEKLFGRKINRIQDSVIRPTQEFAEKQGSGALEKTLLPIAAGIGAIAVESPVGAPAKNPTKKFIKNLVAETSEDIIEKKILGFSPSFKHDPETLGALVRSVKVSDSAKEIAKTFEFAQNKATKAAAKANATGTVVEKLSTRAGNSLQNDPTGTRKGRVDQIVKDYQAGKKFDPVEVRELPDGSIDIIDGRHRLEAARLSKQDIEIKNVSKEFDAPAPKPKEVPKPEPKPTPIREGGDLPKTPDDYVRKEGVVARERFDIPNLEKVSFGGSDRDVYKLGDDKVVKIVKSARGIDQNDAGLDFYAQESGLIPKVFESGDNYVVSELVNKPDARTKELVRTLQKEVGITDVRPDKANLGELLSNVAEKYRAAGDEDIADLLNNYANYDLLINDFNAIRNWGTTKAGMPIHLDEGTLNADIVKKATDDYLAGKPKAKNLDDPEFADIYHRSKAAKKRFADADPKTMYAGFVGTEIDEETGEIGFDPVKAVAGMLGMALYTRHFDGGVKVLLKNLKKHPDYDDAAGQVILEMDLAEAGQRGANVYEKDGVIQKITSNRSTFPQWASEHLRKRDLFDKVVKHIEDGTEPAKAATNQRELYDETVAEIAARLTITHVEPLDPQMARLVEDELSPSDLVKAYDEHAAAQIAKDKAEVNGNYSRVDDDGVLFPAHTLDTLEEIPDTPKKAFLFVDESKGTPAFELPEQTKLQYIRQQVQDKFERLTTTQKAIEKNKGEKLPDHLDAYLQQELYVGRAAERVDIFREDIISSKKKSNKKALLERMRDDDVDVEAMGEYLHARHAKERNAKVRSINEDLPDGGSGMLDAEADEILKKYADNTKISAYADEVYEKITKARLAILEESGLMTKESLELINGSYDNYIPLKVAGKDQVGGTGKGFSVSGKDVKRVRGSLKDRENPLIQAIVDYEATVMKAEKNKVAQTFAKLVTENPNKDLWEIENLQYKPRYDKNGDVITLDPKFKFADNVMEVRFDGKVQLITINDKELARAMKNLGNEKAISKTLLTINNYLRGVNTFYNPEFMITNFERDIQTALINISGEESTKLAGKVAADIKPAMQGIYRSLRGKEPVKKKGTDWSAIYDEMKAEGGRVGWFDLNDVQKRTDETIKLIKRYNGDTTGDKALRAIDSAAETIDSLNESVEMAVRLSTYKNAVDAGVSKQKAAQMAKNLTVNFNKKGNLGTAMNSLYLFANAGIQGSTRIVQAMRHPRTRKIALGISAFSYGMAEVNRNINEEQYSRISDFEKDTNLILMLPEFFTPDDGDVKDGIISGDAENGYFLKLRLPYGYNIFKVIGDVAYNQVHQEKTPAEEMKHMLMALDASFNPLSSGSALQLVSPTVADPIVQRIENKNFFGSPIKPEQSQYAPEVRESSLYFKSARDTSVAVAEWLNDVTGGDEVKAGLIDISPEIIDHYIDFIGGGLGKLIANTGDSLSLVSQGEMPEVDNMPFVRKFVGTPFENTEKFEVYNMLDRSATRKLKGIERERFIDDLETSLKSGQLDSEQGKKIIKTFMRNEAKLDAGGVFKTVLNGTDEEVAEAIADLSPTAREELTKLLKKEAEDRLEKNDK